MKVRNGFVSNSSSSSFVLIGCQLSEKEIVEKLNINIDGDDVSEKIDELDLFWSSEDDIIGYLIADGDGYDFGGEEMTIPQVMEKAQMVAQKLSVTIEEIKILSGVRSY